MTKPKISAGRDITIAELIDRSLTQKPDYEITGQITTPTEKEESMNSASNPRSSASNKS